MASVLHGSARTTPRIRAELQASKESARSLAARYDLNPKTVRKWRQRTTTTDAPMGPKAPKSTVLTPAEEAIGLFPRLARIYYGLSQSAPDGKLIMSLIAEKEKLEEIQSDTRLATV